MAEKTFIIPHFPHDVSASNDPKLVFLRAQYGWAGVGIFWAIIEALHKEPDGRLASDHFNAIVKDFWRYEGKDDKYSEMYQNFLYANALLTLSDGYATSLRAQKNLAVIRQKSEKAKESALARWGLSKPHNANAKRTQSERNAIKEDKIREDKSKKESVKKKDAPPQKEVEKDWNPKDMTPKEQANLFFDKALVGDFEPFLSELISKGISKEVAQNELSKFARYWSELNGTGQKARWQLMDTFEVPRRLITWFERASRDYKPEGGNEAWRVPLKIKDS